MTLRPTMQRPWIVVAMIGSALTVSPRQRDAATPTVWATDLSVQTLEVSALKRGGPITARVVVATDNHDARAARLEILLPVGVGVLRIPESCHASPSPVASLSARVSCTLGDLPVRALREVSITTTGVPAPDAPLHFAVFVFSDTPDPAPMNNFAERVLP